MEINLKEQGSGYNPENVEHDLIMIRRLMKGKKKMTMQLAKEIYYRINVERIHFLSDTGNDFLDKVMDNMSEWQRIEIDELLLKRQRRQHNVKLIMKINKRITMGITLFVLIACIVCINWSLIMDVRTNYETDKLQDKIVVLDKDNVDYIDNSTPPINIEVENIEQSTTSSSVVIADDITLASSGKVDKILDKYIVLHEENPDFAGWLKINGTKIDYPVMSRENDNNYYLDKNFKGEKDKNGLLILDYRSDVLAHRQNIIIYGHNMKTGVMFGTLKKYKDKAFAEQNSIINLDTLYEECEYKVIAALLSEVAYADEDVFKYYDAIDISTEENFNAFKEHILTNSLYVMDENIEYGDSCLVLSTCDNYKEDGRFVVIAKKIE